VGLVPVKPINGTFGILGIKHIGQRGADFHYRQMYYFQFGSGVLKKTRHSMDFGLMQKPPWQTLKETCHMLFHMPMNKKSNHGVVLWILIPV
jgi:hypothetical protein